MKKFQDHFSDHAFAYAKNRPTYPEAMVEWLSRKVPDKSCVWDCATGNGQVAELLSRYFDSVIATDASREQIAAARPVKGVEFRVAPAETSGLRDHSITLITVAQALHWFDIDRFYEEARRVLVENGILAVWCYELCSVIESVDRLLLDFYKSDINSYWPPERTFIEGKYEEISFPFNELEVPRFKMELKWSADQMLAYLRTWSAVKGYQIEHKEDPVTSIESDLKEAWGCDLQRVRWPLNMKVARI